MHIKKKMGKPVLNTYSSCEAINRSAFDSVQKKPQIIRQISDHKTVKAVR